MRRRRRNTRFFEEMNRCKRLQGTTHNEIRSRDNIMDNNKIVVFQLSNLCSKLIPREERVHPKVTCKKNENSIQFISK
jgi:hypothetical protein